MGAEGAITTGAASILVVVVFTVTVAIIRIHLDHLPAHFLLLHPHNANNTHGTPTRRRWPSETRTAALDLYMMFPIIAGASQFTATLCPRTESVLGPSVISLNIFRGI